MCNRPMKGTAVLTGSTSHGHCRAIRGAQESPQQRKMRKELVIRHPSALAPYRERTAKPKATKEGLEHEQQHPQPPLALEQQVSPQLQHGDPIPSNASRPWSHTCPRNPVTNTKCLSPAPLHVLL